jgi:hypothetical protein
MAEAQPVEKIRAKRLSLADQYQALATSLEHNRHDALA